jgi:NAD(P)-dependent dehydrogenase (short-subunit alcohol dehydrogenase family)
LETGKYWIEKDIPGVVVNIVTTYAWTGTGYTVPSACAKAGVLALTRSLAVEWGRKYNIRMNAIAPGPFPTKGAWDRLFPDSVRDQFDPAFRVPLKRVGDRQELSNLTAYLLSDYSAYINGEVITIDGGEWLENGGQFNAFREVSDEMWDMLSAFRNKKK